MNRKPIICLDFDGVIHSYTSGWKGPRNIPDPPVEGALDFMYHALVAGYRVVVHSSRARYFGGRWAMRRWLWHHAGDVWEVFGGDGLSQVEFWRTKPPAVLTIDDRAITFTGTFPSLAEIEQFTPWNKK
jgi:hypothetical protein